MGLKIDMTEINTQIKSIDVILKQKNAANHRLEASIIDLGQADELSGQAYERMKTHFLDYHLPIVRGIIAANEAILEANQIFKQQFVLQVDTSEGARIDEDHLQALAVQMNSLSNYLNEAQSNNQAYTASSQNPLLHTQKIIEQIQKLHDFNFSCAQIYSFANQLLEQVAAGIAYLNNGTYNVKTQTFTPAPSASTSWLNKLSQLNTVSKAEIETIAKRIPNLTKQDLRQLNNYLGQNPSSQLPESILAHLRENQVAVAADPKNELLLVALNRSGKFINARTAEAESIHFQRNLGKITKHSKASIIAAKMSKTYLSEGTNIGQGIAYDVGLAGSGAVIAGLFTKHSPLSFHVGISIVADIGQQNSFGEWKHDEVGQGVPGHWEKFRFSKPFEPAR
ncbi:T7SS effector LXG polymorphic toxin [Listeria kieliensis]|uniref:LXG domain-containing protein n=1 Tax=Listeria kieliensis TaxID=1621700 RepID=A0A3D8TTF1_9LIST|nr:T7SS effector LXG polymorphic toxin [Listeria kieliensis]RDX02069.1 hypothetical protein UR08_00565 [Listeria kieliensis]